MSLASLQRTYSGDVNFNQRPKAMIRFRFVNPSVCTSSAIPSEPITNPVDLLTELERRLEVRNSMDSSRLLPQVYWGFERR